MPSPSTVSSRDAELEAVLEIHRAWWQSNIGLDISRMRECFAKNDKFMMFNLNGFLYFSVEELVRLWEWLRAKDVEFSDIETRIVRYERKGDMAWLAIEAKVRLRGVGANDFSPRILRGTEIYHRDDGDGARAWKMWHFHCSDHAGAEKLRMGFEDTFSQRGIGGNPYMAPIVGLEAR